MFADRISCILKDTILLLLMAAITELQVGYPVLVPFLVADVGVLKHKLNWFWALWGRDLYIQSSFNHKYLV